MSSMSHALLLEETVEVSRINHRLAMGVQWINALTRLPAGGQLVSELETIGTRALTQRFNVHLQSRHALRWSGRLSKILTLAAEEKIATPPPNPEDDQTNFCLRTYSTRDLTAPSYKTYDDPRFYVPRRLSLTPVQTGGLPASTAANIRQAWLWPGANFPLASNTTAIRGRIQRGPDLNTATPVPWCRVVLTLPGALPANFATEVKVGWAHGDDRGEFLAVLGAQAVPGGAILPPSLTLRMWVFLPPPQPLDEENPLSSLPLEQAGSNPFNDVLRGIEAPASYTRQAAIDVVFKPGEVLAMNDAVLLFP